MSRKTGGKDAPPDVVIIDDDDGEPPKAAEKKPSKEELKLLEKVSKLEERYEAACQKERTAQGRIAFLETLIEKKEVISSNVEMMKKQLEKLKLTLTEKSDEFSLNVEEARRNEENATKKESDTALKNVALKTKIKQLNNTIATMDSEYEQKQKARFAQLTAQLDEATRNHESKIRREIAEETAALKTQIDGLKKTIASIDTDEQLKKRADALERELAEYRNAQPQSQSPAHQEALLVQELQKKAQQYKDDYLIAVDNRLRDRERADALERKLAEYMSAHPPPNQEDAAKELQKKYAEALAQIDASRREAENANGREVELAGANGTLKKEIERLQHVTEEDQTANSELQKKINELTCELAQLKTSQPRPSPAQPSSPRDAQPPPTAHPTPKRAIYDPIPHPINILQLCSSEEPGTTVTYSSALKQLVDAHYTILKGYLQSKESNIRDVRLECDVCDQSHKSGAILIHFFTRGHAKVARKFGVSLPALQYWLGVVAEANSKWQQTEEAALWREKAAAGVATPGKTAAAPREAGEEPMDIEEEQD